MRIMESISLAIYLVFFLWISEINGLEEKEENSFDEGNYRNMEQLLKPSLQQSTEGLGKLFHKIDSDNDNFLSPKEIAEWIVMSDNETATNEAKIHLKLYDVNKDNGLSWMEFVKGSYGEIGVINDTRNSDHHEILKMLEDDKFKFQVADFDKDSLLDLSELTAFYHPHNYVEMLDYEAFKAVKDYDRNEDNEISREEYSLIHFGTNKPNERQRLLLDNIFNSYDKNKNKKLSVDEIKLWLKPSVYEHAMTEAERLVHLSDSNNDGKLSKEEVMESVIHWMDSKATNFGSHLRDEL